MKQLFLFIIFVVLSCTAGAWPAKVVGISDGDTITVLRNGNEQVKIRLYGIDAPENSQPYGKASKSNLSSLIYGKNVEINPIDTDKYERTVAMVNLNGINANAEQIRAGNAWLYKQYCRDSLCSDWGEIESEARTGRVGLWIDSNPTPPWEWRHGGQVIQKKADASLTVAANISSYHGNINSGIFHRPGCQHYNCKNCIAVFASREEAISNGYRPCKICKP